ncbi:MAG: hypothetical protein KTR28_05175 [Micavibrio sp.]|nr:hypothetical protein [Micavibrio sp.]
MLFEWKLAADGAWENGITIKAEDSATRLGEVLERVKSWPQNVAIEAVFDESGNGVPAAMYGVRMTELPKSTQAQKVAALFNHADELKDDTQCLTAMNKLFPEYDLFPKTPSAINIGQIDLWASFGDYTLWTLEKGVALGADDLKKEAPRYFDDVENPLAVEKWYASDGTERSADHWYKIYVSDEIGSGHKINTDKYQTALQKMLAPQ